MLSSGVLADELVFGLVEDNVHRHRTSWLFNCALSSETIAETLSSSGQLTFSEHFHILLDSTISTTSPSYLVFSLSFLFHPSIFPPIYPFIPQSTHLYTIHPSIHPFIQERMGE